MSGSSRSLQSHGIWVTLILHFLSRSSSLFHSVLKIKFNLYSEPVFLHFCQTVFVSLLRIKKIGSYSSICVSSLKQPTGLAFRTSVIILRSVNFRPRTSTYRCWPVFRPKNRREEEPIQSRIQTYDVINYVHPSSHSAGQYNRRRCIGLLEITPKHLRYDRDTNGYSYYSIFLLSGYTTYKSTIKCVMQRKVKMHNMKIQKILACVFHVY